MKLKVSHVIRLNLNVYHLDGPKTGFNRAKVIIIVVLRGKKLMHAIISPAGFVVLARKIIVASETCPGLSGVRD